MSCIIVERTFETALTQKDLDAAMERLGSCLDKYNARWVHSYWSNDRKRMVCEYEALDAESVRQLQQEAQAPFDRVWVADILRN